MAFPSVRDASTGVETANTTTWDVSYPASVGAGDLLLWRVGTDGGSRTFSGLEAGWAQQRILTDGSCSLSIWTKVATGAETGLIGTGGTDITCSGSEQGAWRLSSIMDWEGTIADGFRVSTGATGASDSPNPDTLSPTWGADDTLWLVAMASDGGVLVTAYPSTPSPGFTLDQFADHSGGGAGAGMASAGMNLNTATVDPGVFTLSGADGWAAVTMAIRPGAPAAAIPRHSAATFQDPALI